MDRLESGLATAGDVNAAAERHHNETEMVQAMWDTQISSLHDTRRAEFRAWIMSLRHDDEALVTAAAAASSENFDYGVGGGIDDDFLAGEMNVFSSSNS